MKIKRSKLFVNTENSDQYDSHDYGCNSWIEYWQRKKSGPLAPNCKLVCPSCKMEYKISDMVGGHVTDILTREMYITPICKYCNDKKENLSPFIVKDEMLVPFIP